MKQDSGWKVREWKGEWLEGTRSALSRWKSLQVEFSSWIVQQTELNSHISKPFYY